MPFELAELVSRQAESDDGSHGTSMPLIRAFISFQLFGLCGVIIMLVTVLFMRGPVRHHLDQFCLFLDHIHNFILPSFLRG